MTPPPDALGDLTAFFEAQRWRWHNAAQLVAEEVAGTSCENALSLVYGEITEASLWALLDEFAPRFAARSGGACFADLGAGCGKAVLCAAVHPAVRAAAGVECVAATHAVSVALADAARAAGLLRRRVRLARGSLTRRTEWTSCDLVYVNCVTWPDELMAATEALAARMRPGSLLLTVSLSLRSAAFRHVARRVLRFSWGRVAVHVQERMPHGDAWQRRRLLPRGTATADWLLDAPQLTQLGALSVAGGAGAGASPQMGALLALPPDAVVLVPCCGDSPLPRQLAALPGVRHVAAFDLSAAAVAAQLQAAAAAGIPVSRLSFFVADAVDPLCDPPTWRLLQQGSERSVLEPAQPFEWLNNGTFDAVIDQCTLDTLLPLAEGGAVAAGRALAASCAALKPGGAALLLSARSGPGAALPLLRRSKAACAALAAGVAAWAGDVTHAQLAAPPGSPAHGATLHAYVCRVAPAATMLVLGTRCVPASVAARWTPDAPCCSFAAAGKAMLQQPLYECLSCALEAVCAPCVRACHVSHVLRRCRQRTAAEDDHDDASSSSGSEGEWSDEEREAKPLLCDFTVGYCECGFSGACTVAGSELSSWSSALPS